MSGKLRQTEFDFDALERGVLPPAPAQEALEQAVGPKIQRPGRGRKAQALSLLDQTEQLYRQRVVNAAGVSRFKDDQACRVESKDLLQDIEVLFNRKGGLKRLDGAAARSHELDGVERVFYHYPNAALTHLTFASYSRESVPITQISARVCQWIDKYGDAVQSEAQRWARRVLEWNKYQHEIGGRNAPGWNTLALARAIWTHKRPDTLF